MTEDKIELFRAAMQRLGLKVRTVSQRKKALAQRRYREKHPEKRSAYVPRDPSKPRPPRRGTYVRKDPALKGKPGRVARTPEQWAERYPGLREWVVSGKHLKAFAQQLGEPYVNIKRAARHMGLRSKRLEDQRQHYVHIHELVASGCLDTTTIASIVGVHQRQVQKEFHRRYENLR